MIVNNYLHWVYLVKKRTYYLMSLDWKYGSCLLLFFTAEFTAILYQKTVSVPISRSSICDIYLVIGESLNVLK